MERFSKNDRAVSPVDIGLDQKHAELLRSVDVQKVVQLTDEFEQKYSSSIFRLPEEPEGAASALKEMNDHARDILVEFGMSSHALLSWFFADKRAPVIAVESESKKGIRHWAAPYADYTLGNLRRMLTIEQHTPGAVRYLHQQHGISNFSRFNAEFWKRQYEERESTLPYMLIMLASALEKASLSHTTEYIALQDRLKALPQPHLMRMAEVLDIPDALRRLARFDAKYNSAEHNPIKLLMFDGHGNQNSLYLGGTGKYSFETSDVQDERFEKTARKHLPQALAHHAQVILGACETAKGRGNIAEALKRELKKIYGNHIDVVGTETYAGGFTNMVPSLRDDGALSLGFDTLPFPPKYEHASPPRYRSV